MLAKWLAWPQGEVNPFGSGAEDRAKPFTLVLLIGLGAFGLPWRLRLRGTVAICDSNGKDYVHKLYFNKIDEPADEAFSLFNH